MQRSLAEPNLSLDKPDSQPNLDRRSFFRQILLRGVEQAEKAGQSVRRRMTVRRFTGLLCFSQPPGHPGRHW